VGVTWVGWVLTIGVIVVLLGLDLVLATVRPHAVGYKEAAVWSAAYIAVAVVFGVILGTLSGWGYGGQYFAGYLVEKSLSVDNLFVFVIIMATFAVPREHRQRVLVFGIIAALALRAVFIAIGAALLSALSFMFLIFGLLLVWTAVRLYRHRDEDPDISSSGLVRASRRILPVSDSYDGGRLISRAGGRRVVTPLPEHERSGCWAPGTRLPRGHNRRNQGDRMCYPLGRLGDPMTLVFVRTLRRGRPQSLA